MSTKQRTGSGAEPVMSVLLGGASSAVLSWEAELERDVARAITDHLQQNPSPGSSQVGDDLEQWAERLCCDAQSRLGLAAPWDGALRAPSTPIELVPTSRVRRVDRSPTQRAWAHVADGIGRALTIDGLPADDRTSLTRSYRNACRAAGAEPLRTV